MWRSKMRSSLEEFVKKQVEILTIQEYLNKRKEERKNEEGKGKVLTNFEWNVMIHE